MSVYTIDSWWSKSNSNVAIVSEFIKLPRISEGNIENYREADQVDTL